MKRLSIITSYEGHMNRTLSHRAVSRIAGFLLAFAIAGLSGCIEEEDGTCRYRTNREFLGGAISGERTVSSAVECQSLCSDEGKTDCQFTPQTAITGP